MLETLYFVIALNLIGFLVAFRFKTDKLTDISYALSFASIALYGAYSNEFSLIQWCVFALVLLWSARLGSFLLYRVHVVGKDGRFDEMRKSFFAFGRFWLLQAITSWVVMLPESFLFLTEKTTSLQATAVFGLIIAFFGIIFEAIADWQKFKFNRNPKNKGKWIERGLWKYSRHPNYFGEILTWYGVWAACMPWLDNRSSYIGILSPLIITVLLVGISGIPILEKSADKRWGKVDAYKSYRRKTSVLVPWIRKV